MTGKICVLLDACSWISERLLRSSMGAALIHLLLQQQLRIGLPESVEAETSRQLIDQGVKAIDDVQQRTRILEQLSGQPLRGSPLNEAVIRHGIQQRWQELAPVIEKLPLSMDIVRAALDRVIGGIPPSKQSEQFRDCCLWEQAIQIAAQHEVHLVTSDKDFYEKRDYSQGLAIELRDHSATISHKIVLDRTVEDYVKSFGQSIRIGIKNEYALAKKITAYIESGLKKSAAERSFELGSLARFTVNSFPTDKPTSVAISYELTYKLIDQNSPAQRASATVTAYGDCTLDPTKQTVSEVRPDRETFSWVDGRGISQQSTTQYAYGPFGGI